MKSTTKNFVFLSESSNCSGLFHYLKVDFFEAFHDFTIAISLNRSNHAAYYNRALVEYRLGICYILHALYTIFVFVLS